MDTPIKKGATRRVFGRLKNVEAVGGLYTFELTKDGLVVHRRNHRRRGDRKLGFGRLVAGGGVVVPGLATFTLTEDGLEIVKRGVKRVVSWERLENTTRVQPELFA